MNIEFQSFKVARNSILKYINIEITSLGTVVPAVYGFRDK
jgi:hypothetical protein